MNDQEAKNECIVCDGPIAPDWGDEWCERCRLRYPYPLLKATMNNWEFCAKLTTGELVRFTSAIIVGDSVTLVGVTWPSLMGEEDPTPGGGFINFRRGLVVRVEHIVWCVDQGN